MSVTVTLCNTTLAVRKVLGYESLPMLKYKISTHTEISAITVGKTSPVLDMVDVHIHDSGWRWISGLYITSLLEDEHQVISARWTVVLPDIPFLFFSFFFFFG